MPGTISTLTSPNFLTLLADELLRNSSADLLSFSETLILLPNRRSCRTLQEILLKQSAGRSLILPKIRPIGDVDEEELLFADITSGALDIPQPVSSSEQRLLLASLIRKWQEAHRKAEGIGFDQASDMALELIQLLNEVEREQLSWDNLHNLVPEHYAAHWQDTLSFLEIIAKHWPVILAEKGKINPVDYRNRLLKNLAETWQQNPPEFRVIAAGSTGSVLATRQLLKVIAGLPHGRIILPGLDMVMDEESWQAVDASHPQHSLKRLLAFLGVARREVASEKNSGRSVFISELMRPAKTTHQWLDYTPGDLSGLTIEECATQQEEAGVIALILREVLETPEKKAAFVTHDRGLALRVKTLLQRWEIEVDDSAGEPLLQTPPAVFLMLLADMVHQKIAPVPLLSVLRHPLCAVGENEALTRENARALELAALRGVRPKEGFDGIFSRVVKNPENQELVEWLREVEKACRPFISLMEKPHGSAAVMVRAHIAAAENVSGTLWDSEEGKQLASVLEEIIRAAEGLNELESWGYSNFLRGLLKQKTFRPSYGSHPRLAILSPQEARLLDVDCVVLGGLNEGSWPPTVVGDSWMNLAMREKFGLPSKEQKIGQAAHDMCQLLHMKEVVITRAAKVDGKPTIPSRWLLRLGALIGKDAVASKKPWKEWAATLYQPEVFIESLPPLPVPPVETRPTALFVTQIERLMRDPYAIYASHILKLKPLEPLDKEINQADFGNVVHDVLAEFIDVYDSVMPGAHLETLLALGQKALGKFMEESPSAEVFWWSKFERIAAWFIEEEAARRKEGKTIFAEREGVLELNIDGKSFHIKARADRIEAGKSGEISIVDYKTGTIPSKPEIALGFACQMTLEAVIAEAGGFPVSGKVENLEYWKLKGNEPPVEVNNVKSPQDYIVEAKQGITSLLSYFAKSNTAYPSEPWPDYAPHFSDYRHLARVKEWQSSGN